LTLPNNIGLDQRSPLTMQLTAYEAKFHAWWHERGPAEFLDLPMRLRVPTGAVTGAEWAAYTVLRPNDYRWGLYSAPTETEQISFGEHRGHKVWNEAPSEYRMLLLQHICAQADVENAAVEQSRMLTATVPGFVDLENLFQFYLEEGRHTWAMVHLLLAYFGSDGAAEAHALLERMSGDADNPRLLDAFNYPTDDWLSHFLWCFLADRVGKFQVNAVARCAFAPLARAARFMRFEEPLHIAFGVFGLERVLISSARAAQRWGVDRGFAAGAIPLTVVQKYLNYWVPKNYDLFGDDDSEHAYNLLRAGIRIPRNFVEDEEAVVSIDARLGGQIVQTEIAAEWGTNTIMRRQFILEVQKTVDRWNGYLQTMALDFQLYLPHERFGRSFGPCAGLPFDVDGNLLRGDPEAKRAEYFPTAAERANVRSLMERELRPGHCAPWIAPPRARVDMVPGSRDEPMRNR
jgi:benzoyl-CoA 2,3-dioxygenase component B